MGGLGVGGWGGGAPLRVVAADEFAGEEGIGLRHGFLVEFVVDGDVKAAGDLVVLVPEVVDLVLAGLAVPELTPLDGKTSVLGGEEGGGGGFGGVVGFEEPKGGEGDEEEHEGRRASRGGG